MLYKSKYDVELKFARYANNGATAILLQNIEDNAPVATATVNLDDEWFDMMVSGPEGHRMVGIKDYSENEGMVDFLLENEVIKPEKIMLIPSGMVLVGLYALTDKYADLALAIQQGEGE